MAEDKFQVSDDIQVSLSSVPLVADREFQRLLLLWMAKRLLESVEKEEFDIDANYSTINILASYIDDLMLNPKNNPNLVA